jgi:hypothetical protein
VKKIRLTLLTFIICQILSAQFSVGAGVGLSSKADFVKLQLQYEFSHVGFSTGYFAHIDNTNPVYFTAEAFTPLRINENLRLVIHGGGAYKLKSNDNKDLNGWKGVYGLDVENGINYHVTVVFGFSRTTDNINFFTLALRGVFGQKPDCY